MHPYLINITTPSGPAALRQLHRLELQRRLIRCGLLAGLVLVGGQGRSDDLAFGVDEEDVVSANFIGFGVDVDNYVEFAHG